jgi:hypothetical protein
VGIRGYAGPGFWEQLDGWLCIVYLLLGAPTVAVSVFATSLVLFLIGSALLGAAGLNLWLTSLWFRLRDIPRPSRWLLVLAKVAAAAAPPMSAAVVVVLVIEDWDAVAYGAGALLALTLLMWASGGAWALGRAKW